MKYSFTLLIALIFSLLFLSSLCVAEDLELKASHGGLVKKTSSAFLELVQDKERTSIYITGHDHKNITDKKLSLSAIALVKGKKFPVELSFENDHYSASPANTYLHKEKNYVLMITIELPGNKAEQAAFHINR